MSTRRFDARYDPAVSTLFVSGEIDEDVLGQLDDRLREATADHSRSVVVDLTAVDYLPSVAIGALLSATQRATRAGHHLEVVAAHDTIAARVLAITGVPFRAT